MFEAGVFVIRDNPQGRRDDKGRIIEAYGFDLSPLAQRCDEFVKIDAVAKVERDAITASNSAVSLSKLSSSTSLTSLLARISLERMVIDPPRYRAVTIDGADCTDEVHRVR